VYVAVAALAGAAAGLLGAEYQLPGALAGVACGVEGVSAVALLLSVASRVPWIALIIMLVVGMLPGIGLYWRA
jgi:hypothetical protein